ncbi:MAG: FAD-dependent oxidoreductase [Bacilli bacterium]|nr:FAD-dependent oxidoreductase [Bacilli bacterium]
MKNTSIWLDGIKKQKFRKLEKDIDVDVLIVGGGITGVSSAYHLSTGDLSVCLVEKNKLLEGVTSRTTGKLTYLQENIYSKLVNYHGKENSKLYLDSQRDAIKLVRGIIDSNKIDCNLEKVKSYVFDFKDIESVEEEIHLLNEFGVDLKLSDVLPSGENINSSYFVDDTYVFHPLKYLSKLVDICVERKVDIYEDTKVVSIDEEDGYYICRTDNNLIKAKYVVIAVHYPYFLFPFLMPFKSYLEKSYIEAFKVKKNYNFSAINISKPIVSTRFYENNGDVYQILLTNSHNYCFKNNEEKNFEELFKSDERDTLYTWSNKDIMTNDLLPYIGRLNDSNILIGTGYNTWGMTNGSLAGKIISDIILDRKNRYIELFNPHRKLNLGSFLNFPVALFSSAYSFIKTKVSKNKEWYSNRVRFEKRNGKNVGIYVDDEGEEHIVYNLCPHMKCSLIFNEIEKTWDCPCHGSRFNIDGKSIEGPSNYDITYSEE